MTDKILTITEKIYNEGVVRAKEDAEKIIKDAKKEAERIIYEANEENRRIIDSASKNAEEIIKNANAELQLAAKQFISKLKKQITETITTTQVHEPIKESFNQIEFVKKTIETLIQNWDPKHPEKMDLKILLPEKDKNDFSEFMDNKALETMNKGVEIQYDRNIENGFKIGPKDGSYVISFSAKDFEYYFKKYFKERTRKLLFEE